MAAPLEISHEKLGFIVEKAREFDMQVNGSDLEDGSNPSDDREVGILESSPDNPAEEELRGALMQLDEDELVSVLALVWVGRGDFTVDAWTQALDEAAAARDDKTIDRLVGTTMLGDLIEEGAATLGHRIKEDEVGSAGHLPPS